MSKYVITIGRQFGSGGGLIGKKTAELLGIPCYDKEIIIKSAEDSGISREAVEAADERTTNSFLYSLAMSSYSGQLSAIGASDVLMSDRVYLIQSETIRKLSSQGSCVIIGRCADDVLANVEGLIKIFIYAPFETRCQRIAETHNVNEHNAKTLTKKTDKKRASYYNFYTSKNWGFSDNYHLSIDSSILGIDKTAEFLKKFIELKLNT
ncbi:cytidylate kinase-like family protein [Eubacteriales bacterium OttesenSCG-928-G02]|nr:cytidylate kinase-like family protein [Eubacteriales bacterium OttesenSCG-928-G02]